MSKKIIQDIISNVVGGSSGESRGEEIIMGRNRGGKSFWFYGLLTIVIVVLIMSLFLLFSSSFSRVTINITTTKRDVKLDDLAFLNREGVSGIRYDVMRIEDTESFKVPTTGSKTVQKYAKGKVTIYNTYSKSAQKLVINTRLQTKDGKIFKIDKAVSIPGFIVANGKILPGSVGVSVTASQPGTSYNIPPSDFTVPGLKGGEKFEKIYAKSTKEITGGFMGEIKIVSSSDLKNARIKIEESLKQKLERNALLQTPKGFLLYDDGMFIDFKNNILDGNSLMAIEGDSSILKIDAVLNAVIIGENDIANFVVENKLPQATEKNSKIKVSGLEKISLKILNREKINILNSASIPIKLGGNLLLVWDFDETGLKERLLGIKKTKYQEVLKDFPVIEKAEAVFSPSWALYFPGDPKRIEITR